MTASLVSLFQPRNGWSNEERAQFARIERLLEDAGFAVDVEHGLSDEGEPWCVFCSRATGDVIIHAACIDGRFMFDSSTLPRPIEGTSFQKCAERFFQDVSLPMPLAHRRNEVLLHPSALLASLFITILLYAQATTEQPLFAEPSVDVDGEDDAGLALSPLALRLRAIAQQVAEFVAADSGSNGNGSQQTYTSAAAAAIPAGMALAVIAIAQDLAVAQALFGEEIERQALPGSAEAEAVAAADQVVLAEADTQAEPVEARGEVLLADGEDGGADAPASETRGAELAAIMAAVADALDIGAVQDKAAAMVDALADGVSVGIELAGLVGAALAPEQPGETADDGVRLADAGFSLDAVLDDILELAGLDAAERFVGELAGRIVEFEVLRVADGFVDRLETALLSGDYARDSLDLITGAEGGEIALADAGGSGGGFEAVTPGADVPSAGQPPVSSDGGSGAAVVPPVAVAEPELREPLGPQTGGGPRTTSGVSVETLIAAFDEAVGEMEIRVEDDGDMVFWDTSLSIHVDSRDIVFEAVYLEDNTKLLFVGAAWDFDGFDGLV